jgi:hypothetical protein
LTNAAIFSVLVYPSFVKEGFFEPLAQILRKGSGLEGRINLNVANNSCFEVRCLKMAAKWPSLDRIKAPNTIIQMQKALITRFGLTAPKSQF